MGVCRKESISIDGEGRSNERTLPAFLDDDREHGLRGRGRHFFKRRALAAAPDTGRSDRRKNDRNEGGSPRAAVPRPFDADDELLVAKRKAIAIPDLVPANGRAVQPGSV